jgi:predicted RNase H-like HicB family nuclease
VLTEYLAAAMKHATYEVLPDDQTFFGRIPGFQGVWSNAPTLEACRDELLEVLEEWVALGLRLNHELPEVDGLRLDFHPVA